LLNLAVKKEEITYDAGKRRSTPTTGTGYAAGEKQKPPRLNDTAVGQKASQALKTVTGTAAKVQRNPVIAHLMRAAERFNDRLGNQFGAAITYFSFLSMIPILMVSFAAAGFVLAWHPTLLQDIFDKILQNVSDPTLAATLKNTINTAVQQRTAVGWSACWLPSIPVLTGWATCAKRSAPSRATSGSAAAGRGENLGKYFRDLISLIGLLVALIITLSITSVAGSAQQMIISALYLDYIEWLNPPGADWPGHLHLRQLFAVFLDLLALPRHRPRRKALIRGTLIAAIGFEIIKIVMTWTLPSLVKSPGRGVRLGAGADGLLLFLRPPDAVLRRVDCHRRVQRRPRMPGKTHDNLFGLNKRGKIQPESSFQHINPTCNFYLTKTSFIYYILIM
jgi:membrane protein